MKFKLIDWPIRAHLALSIGLVLVYAVMLLFAGGTHPRWLHGFAMGSMILHWVFSTLALARLDASYTRLNRLSTLLSALPDTVVEFNAQGRYLFSHMDPSDPVGLHLNDVMPEPVRSLYRRSLEEALEEGAAGPFRYTTSRLGRKMSLVTSARRTPYGTVVFLVHDETDVAKVKDDLVESNKSLEQFAYVASHDLREPLRTVRQFCDLLLEDCRDALSLEGRDYIAFIVDAVRRMDDRVRDFLRYSRMGREAARPKSVDSRAVVDQLLLDFRAKIEQLDASVQVRDLPAVEYDPSYLRDILSNLLSNALKFHPHGTHPRVEIFGDPRGVSPDKVKIIVRDHGIGVSSDRIDDIFQAFTRLHSENEYSGTGMGLSIVQKLISRTDAGIQVVPRPDGTDFVICLPRAKGEVR